DTGAGVAASRGRNGAGSRGLRPLGNPADRKRDGSATVPRHTAASGVARERLQLAGSARGLGRVRRGPGGGGIVIKTNHRDTENTEKEKASKAQPVVDGPRSFFF